MSKHKREQKRINEIIERKIKQFPAICPTYIRKIWLDGYSEGRQNKTNKQTERVVDCEFVQESYFERRDNFQHLEVAEKSIRNWPKWKKDIGGIK